MATAAYGSYAEDHVVALRKLRDRYLLSHVLGRSLVHLYYRYSPPLAEFIHGKGHLRSISRMGLLPLVGASLAFTRINLDERWPLLITIAVIISVLLYMELLIRRYRRPRTKPVHPENISHFSSALRSGTTKTSRNSGNS
ncbi:MAG: CFI-box-CTERM domain-containing protein [Candidatus Hydrothermarchaeaceae archaeon]